MNNFLFKQIKFLSGTTALLLCWQSLAIANPSLNKKLTIKKPPQWIAQLSNQNQDVLFPNPRITIDGKEVGDMETSSSPRFLPRAVAPPVGDMAVSNVTNNIPMINLGTSARIPRLVLRDAPATEVLALLTRAAGLNIIFTDQSGEDTPPSTVSLDLENESIQDVFNSVLLISGLKANLQGKTVFVGNKLPPNVKNTITRTIRLNQYNAVAAAFFLNSQGAQGNIIKINTNREERQIIRSDSRDQGEAGSESVDLAVEEVTEEYEVVPLEAKVKDEEILILKGLTVHADPVHNSVTLVGEPYLVQKATTFLTQLDARRRQVAVNVKVVDINLDQNTSFGSSFSFGIDNTGLVQDGGTGVINFGTNNQNVDPQRWRVDGEGNLIPAYNEQISVTEDFRRNLANSLSNSLSQSTNTDLSDQLSRNFSDAITRTLSQFGNSTSFSRDQAENLERALTENLARTAEETLGTSNSEDITNNITRTVNRVLQGLPLGTPDSGRISPFGTSASPDTIGENATIRPGRNFNVPQAFLAQIRANIQSGNAKILTDPTLVVQEGQVGTVELVENIVTSIENEQIGTGDNTRFVTKPVISPAGLILSLDVKKIDDNGFISLVVNPTVSAPGSPQEFESGVAARNTIRPLIERKVSSGLIRLRDGQTLILSGIIQDGERTTVSKVPILGDLPLIGSLFRSSSSEKVRSEVIVLVTPQVLDDSDAYSGFGYNYTPSRETGKFLQERGLNIPTTPY